MKMMDSFLYSPSSSRGNEDWSPSRMRMDQHGERSSLPHISSQSTPNRNTLGTTHTHPLHRTDATNEGGRDHEWESVRCKAWAVAASSDFDLGLANIIPPCSLTRLAEQEYDRQKAEASASLNYPEGRDMSVIWSYLRAHGAHTLHYSMYTYELSQDVDTPLSVTQLMPRMLLLTEEALYKIPLDTKNSVQEEKAFTNARVQFSEIDKIVVQETIFNIQVNANDGVESRHHCICIHVRLADTVASSPSSFVVSFGPLARSRREWLLRLKAVIPTVTILQRNKNVQQGEGFESVPDRTRGRVFRTEQSSPSHMLKPSAASSPLQGAQGSPKTASGSGERGGPRTAAAGRRLQRGDGSDNVSSNCGRDARTTRDYEHEVEALRRYLHAAPGPTVHLSAPVPRVQARALARRKPSSPTALDVPPSSRHQRSPLDCSRESRAPSETSGQPDASFFSEEEHLLLENEERIESERVKLKMEIARMEAAIEHRLQCSSTPGSLSRCSVMQEVSASSYHHSVARSPSSQVPGREHSAWTPTTRARSHALDGDRDHPCATDAWPVEEQEEQDVPTAASKRVVLRDRDILGPDAFQLYLQWRRSGGLLVRGTNSPQQRTNVPGEGAVSTTNPPSLETVTSSGAKVGDNESSAQSNPDTAEEGTRGRIPEEDASEFSKGCPEAETVCVDSPRPKSHAEKSRILPPDPGRPLWGRRDSLSLCQALQNRCRELCDERKQHSATVSATSSGIRTVLETGVSVPSLELMTHDEMWSTKMLRVRQVLGMVQREMDCVRNASKSVSSISMDQLILAHEYDPTNRGGKHSVSPGHARTGSHVLQEYASKNNTGSGCVMNTTQGAENQDGDAPQHRSHGRPHSHGHKKKSTTTCKPFKLSKSPQRRSNARNVSEVLAAFMASVQREGELHRQNLERIKEMYTS